MSTHKQGLQRWTLILGTAFCLLVSGMAYLLWRDGQALKAGVADSMDASHIRIQREGFDDIQLAKTGTQWTMESPCKLPANSQRLEPLLGALTPGALQYDAADVDLEAAGLQTPLAVVYINEVEHRLGITDLSGDRRYLQRGNSVEFVPEWVLSLVNGGMTALSRLEIFTDPLESLTIISEPLSDDEIRSVALTSAEDLSEWQNISAQQIIAWPLTDEQVTLIFRLQAEYTGMQSKSIDVYETNRFTALHLDGSQCAYILALDSLPRIPET